MKYSWHRNPVLVLLRKAFIILLMLPWFAMTFLQLLLEGRRREARDPKRSVKCLFGGFRREDSAEVVVPDGRTIVHLSDLHVPQRFPREPGDGSAWERSSHTLWSMFSRPWRDADARLAEELIATVARERPAAVVVSGDLVDESPHEHQCRAAGRFLAHLRRGLARAGFDVPIYFVLGNHDTKHFGNNWFVARVALLLVAGFSLTLGLALDAGVPAQIVLWTVVGYLLLCCLLDLLLMVIERWSDGPVGAIGGLIEDAASAAARAAGESAKAETGTSLEPTRTPGPSASVKVELFGFDSSARSSLFGFATGRVGRRSLGGRKRKQDDGAACRIAVVHHHPLPVLHDGSEPDAVMMLENAGTFLRACFRHGVQVVLHGHKHVPDVKQLVGADGSGVPIVVAGAGTIFADDSRANRAFGILRWQGGVPRYEPVRLDGAHAAHPLPGEGGREDAQRLVPQGGDAPESARRPLRETPTTAHARGVPAS